VFTVAADVIQPEITDGKAQSVKTSVETALKKSVTFTDSGNSATLTPDAATVGSWLRFNETLDVSFDTASVSGYIATKIPTPTNSSLNTAALTDDLRKALFEDGDTNITVRFIAAVVDSSTGKSYPSTQAGLQSYINDVTSAGGIEISVKQLSGNGWSASSGAETSVVSASTYKLYISLLLLEKIDNGQVNWSDPIQGTTVAKCSDSNVQSKQRISNLCI
jgi:hypothetical protein